jgi:hypothetical protein
MSEQKCDFKLKQGKRITLHGMTDDLSNANITNEKAVLFLKASPACAKFFEVLPSNWRDMTQAIGKPEPTSKKVEAPVTEETVQPDGKEKDFSADEFKLDKIREDNLKKKSEQQLVKMCESLELDSKLFKGKKKEQLIKLLIEKMS